MNRPRVIAMTPTWNAAAHIHRTLDSLARQTYADFTVLISDDCSSDETADICADWASRNARFELVRQPQNLGWVGNANALLRMAQDRADYLLFAWHDDLLAPTYVERLAERLDANPRAVVSFSDMLLTSVDGSQEIQVYDQLSGVTSAHERARTLAWRIGYWWVPVRGMFRADAARRTAGLRRHGAGEFSADWPWMMRLATLGEFERVPETLCYKYFTRSSLSKTWRYDVPAYRAVTRSAAWEVRQSGLSLRDKLRLHLSLASQQWLFERNARDARRALRGAKR